MTTPPSAPPPSQWAVLVDHSKSIITLATALLGLAVTFADKLLGDTPTAWLRGTLISTWVLLVAAIVFTAFALAFAVNYLRNGDRDRAAVLCANLGLIALTLSSIALLFLGFQRFRRDASDPAAAAVHKAQEFAAATIANRRWQLDSLSWVRQEAHYTVVLRADTLAATIVVSSTAEVHALQSRSQPPN